MVKKKTREIQQTADNDVLLLIGLVMNTTVPIIQ